MDPCKLVCSLSTSCTYESKLKRPYFNSIHVIDDPNIEILRLLQVIELYKKSYSSNTHEQILTLAQLPVITSQNTMIGIKRTHEGRGLQTQNRGREINRINDNKIITTAASYNLIVPEDHMTLMMNRDISLVVRINRPPFSIIVVGDNVEVNNQITGTIKAVRKYTELQTILQVENVDLLYLNSKCSAQGKLKYLRI
jgi:ASC-1-like (ASCH) protein